MKIVEPATVLGALDGATVESSSVEEEEGLHIVFADGRTLVIVGSFALYVMPPDKEKLH